MYTDTTQHSGRWWYRLDYFWLCIALCDQMLLHSIPLHTENPYWSMAAIKLCSPKHIVFLIMVLIFVSKNQDSPDLKRKRRLQEMFSSCFNMALPFLLYCRDTESRKNPPMKMGEFFGSVQKGYSARKEPTTTMVAQGNVAFLGSILSSCCTYFQTFWRLS